MITQYIINSILIAFITAYVIDYANFITPIKIFIYRLLNGKAVPYKHFSLKPFDCPLCLTFWITLLYGLILIKTSFILIIFIAICASFTSSISGILINNIFNMLNRLINKIK